MDISMQKLDSFTSVIMADAMAESAAVYEDIQKESQAALTAAEDEALAETYRYIKTEMAKINANSGRALSRKMMEHKRDLFTRREQMADEVMDAVRAKIVAYVKTPAYHRQMKALFARVMELFDGDTTVWLREEDRELESELRQLGGGHTLTFATGRFELGGLEAACPGKKMQIDETYDTTIRELRSHFSELFGLKMGE